MWWLSFTVNFGEVHPGESLREKSKQQLSISPARRQASGSGTELYGVLYLYYSEHQYLVLHSH